MKFLDNFLNGFNVFLFLLGLAVFALIFFLTNSYNQDNNLKLEEAEDKLKKKLILIINL